MLNEQNTPRIAKGSDKPWSKRMVEKYLKMDTSVRGVTDIHVFFPPKPVSCRFTTSDNPSLVGIALNLTNSSEVNLRSDKIPLCAAIREPNYG